jgi:hypothetical protein
MIIARTRCGVDLAGVQTAPFPATRSTRALGMEVEVPRGKCVVDTPLRPIARRSRDLGEPHDRWRWPHCGEASQASLQWGDNTLLLLRRVTKRVQMKPVPRRRKFRISPDILVSARLRRRAEVPRFEEWPLQNAVSSEYLSDASPHSV